MYGELVAISICDFIYFYNDERFDGLFFVFFWGFGTALNLAFCIEQSPFI